MTACPRNGSADLVPVPGPTLHARAYAVVRQQLVGGRLVPGEKLSLRSVADGLGMSMQPVREAVARLVADEALEVTPNRAVRVPRMSAPRFRELTVIRLAIEGFAVEEAARLGDRCALAGIRRQDQAFRRQCRRARPDVEAAVLANHALHFAIYQAAGLPSLMPIIDGLWLRVGPVLNLDMRLSPERLQRGGAEASHAALVAAIADGDPAAARAALVSDIRGAATAILGRGVLVDEADAGPVSMRAGAGS